MRKIIYTILSLAIISGCAKRGSPTGGPIDSIPPVLVNANPKLNSTNFDSEEIRLTFDEFVWGHVFRLVFQAFRSIFGRQNLDFCLPRQCFGRFFVFRNLQLEDRFCINFGSTKTVKIA